MAIKIARILFTLLIDLDDKCVVDLLTKHGDNTTNPSKQVIKSFY